MQPILRSELNAPHLNLVAVTRRTTRYQQRANLLFEEVGTVCGLCVAAGKGKSQNESELPHRYSVSTHDTPFAHLKAVGGTTLSPPCEAHKGEIKRGSSFRPPAANSAASP